MRAGPGAWDFLKSSQMVLSCSQGPKPDAEQPFSGFNVHMCSLPVLVWRQSRFCDSVELINSHGKLMPAVKDHILRANVGLSIRSQF